MLPVADVYWEIRQIALKSACLYRKYGALFIKQDKIIASGFAEVPRGPECEVIGSCPRSEARENYTRHAEFFEKCRVIHAEMSAVLNTQHLGDLEQSSLYLIGFDSISGDIYKQAFPCSLCLRHLIKLRVEDIFVFVGLEVVQRHKLATVDYLGG
jgi:dCMP deaminase